MEVIAPFGFATGCHPRDKFMVQATLASMRHYCPEVPICLVADGGVEVKDLQKQYDLFVLRTEELPEPAMRQLCFQNYNAKMAPMWAGPFERYVWMDSDAIVWGDFTPYVRDDLDFQIFWSEISIPKEQVEPPAWLSHFYFDVQKLGKYDPEFEWRGLAYFSAGVYACRRDVIPFHKWLNLHQFNHRERREIFKFGDQGILNYAVHRGAQRGELRVDRVDLQYLTRHHGRAEIDRDTAGAGWHWPPKIQRPRVAHFPGQKPYLLNWKAYSRAFTIARLEHHRQHRGELGAWAALLAEEWPIYREKIRRRLARLAGKEPANR